MKVVQYLVKEVNQFPSDIECMRYIATIADKVGISYSVSILQHTLQYRHTNKTNGDLGRVITHFIGLLSVVAGAVEEVPPVHGDHCQSQRPAGSGGKQEC